MAHALQTPSPHIPWRYQGLTLGRLTVPMGAAVQALPDWGLDAAGPALDCHGVSLSAALVQVHAALVRAQLAPVPGSEQVDVWHAQTHRCIGQVDRQLARLLGMEMHSAHLLVLSEHGLCLQQRALHKAVDPGLWDTTVGGTCVAGESPDRTLLREMHEEAGLAPGQLASRQLLGHWRLERASHLGPYAAWQHEHIHVWVARLADPHWVPHCHDGEVMAFAWCPLDVLQAGRSGLAITHELEVVVKAPQLQAYLAETEHP